MMIENESARAGMQIISRLMRKFRAAVWLRIG
jgi:hypothetical protein